MSVNLRYDEKHYQITCKVMREIFIVTIGKKKNELMLENARESRKYVSNGEDKFLT